LGSKKGGLWKEVLVSKYGGWRSLGEGGKSSTSSLWWKDLKEVWASEGWGRSFEYGYKWKVGDGKDISLWEDSWLGCDAYIHLRKDWEVVSSPVFSKLWKCKAVPSVVLTAWRMLENKLATRVNLERRGVLVENFVLFVWEGGRVLLFVWLKRFAWPVWYALTGLEYRLCLTLIMRQTLINLG